MTDDKASPSRATREHRASGKDKPSAWQPVRAHHTEILEGGSGLPAPELPDTPEYDACGPVSRRPLHVFVLVDSSWSMRGVKIDAVNEVLGFMARAMADEDLSNPRVQMMLRVLDFSTGARWLVEDPSSPTDLLDVLLQHPLEAHGRTEFGAALRLLAPALSVDRMGRRNLPPVLLLVSDGRPTDSWKSLLNELNGTSWGKLGRSVRIAIGIGESYDFEMLARFTGVEDLVFETQSYQHLLEVLLWVARTVTRSVSRGSIAPDASAGRLPCLRQEVAGLATGLPAPRAGRLSAAPPVETSPIFLDDED